MQPFAPHRNALVEILRKVRWIFGKITHSTEGGGGIVVVVVLVVFCFVLVVVVVVVVAVVV